MNTYLVKSATNYGEVVHLVNADDETEVRNIVLNNDEVWDGYEIEKVDFLTTKQNYINNRAVIQSGGSSFINKETKGTKSSPAYPNSTKAFSIFTAKLNKFNSRGIGLTNLRPASSKLSAII